MSDYYNLLTNLGRSKITDLITSDAALENIQIAFGDGNGSVPTPNPARTALVNEVHRRPADKLEHHPTLTNNIIVDVVIPASVGSFWIREFGIYFDGVLICHGSLPPSYKEASEDGVNTYRLKPYINVESDRLKVVEIEGNLINATESWTQENFINRGEIADNLTTDDATKVASAKQVKILNDDKANKTTTLTAGNGLSGGGTLEANRTLTLGTPSKITGSTTNSVTATSHTHEIDNASISVAGVVKLNNTLRSTSTSEAATANTVKLLNDRFVNDFLSLKSENGYQKLPGGLIIQWGLSTGASSRTATFPIAFPNECLNISGSTYLPLGNFQTCSFRNATNQNFGIQTGDVNNVAQPNPVKWFAIGY